MLKHWYRDLINTGAGFASYVLYLYLKQPINENGKTLILDEGVDRQADRPFVWNRCLSYVAATTIALGTGISGTLTLKGWTKVSGDWSYGDITAGLSGTTLTLQSGVTYGSIERYDNTVFVDVILCEVGQGATEVSVDLNGNYNQSFTITTGNIALVRDTDDTKSLLSLSGDLKGIITCDEGEFSLDYTGTTTNATNYRGRKDWPLTPYQAIAFNFPNTADYIQSTSDLTGITIVSVWGGDLTTDFVIDETNDRIKASSNNKSFGRMELSNGAILEPSDINISRLFDVSGGGKSSNVVVANLINNYTTQNTYSSIIERGFSNYFMCDNYRINFHSYYQLIPANKEWDLKFYGVPYKHNNGYSLGGPSHNLTIDGRHIRITAIINSHTVQFEEILPSSPNYNFGYIELDLEFRQVSGNDASLKCTVTTNQGTYIITKTKLLDNITNVSYDDFICPNVIGQDLSVINLYYKAWFKNVTDDIIYNIIEDAVRVDTTSQFSEGGTTAIQIKAPASETVGIDAYGKGLDFSVSKNAFKGTKVKLPTFGLINHLVLGDIITNYHFNRVRGDVVNRLLVPLDITGYDSDIYAEYVNRLDFRHINNNQYDAVI